jgi:hypothetical protein
MHTCLQRICKSRRTLAPSLWMRDTLDGFVWEKSDSGHTGRFCVRREWFSNRHVDVQYGGIKECAWPENMSVNEWFQFLESLGLTKTKQVTRLLAKKLRIAFNLPIIVDTWYLGIPILAVQGKKLGCLRKTINRQAVKNNSNKKEDTSIRARQTKRQWT